MSNGPTTVAELAAFLRLGYEEAVRLAAWEGVLVELAESRFTSRLHSDTSRFQRGKAAAYAHALGLVLYLRGEDEERPNLSADLDKARRAVGESDLAPLRRESESRYRPFDPRTPGG
jgi:hypothetical protein